MIDRGTIDRIFATADIVEVISDFVKLKKTGANYKGFSPFTNEKTPSFFVSPSKGIFKCFSSGTGGNAVTFLMEHEKLSYPEALKYLARKYNIEVVEKELTEDEKKEKNIRESLLLVTDYAKNLFTEWLWERDEGKAVGLSYFKERGFREPVIKKFQLGYSYERRDAFSKTALENGYKLEYLTTTGLTIDKGNYQFDRFNGRVIFPIHGLSGQVLGFGGRLLKKEEKAAKYLNSPESEIYHKSSVLYGLYFAKQSIIKQDRCYLVEGYTDVLSMYQSGIENVVSSSGTALTKEQIRLISRFTKNVTVLYDGDEAGIKASLRGIDLILEEGLNVKVMLLPEGEDPDSYAQKHSSTEFLDFIKEKETDFIKFKTGLLAKDAENDPVKRATLITDVVRSISVIPDNIIRSVYIRECSKILDIDENLLYQETSKIRHNKFANQAKKTGYVPEYQTPKNQNTQKVSLEIENEYLHEKDLIAALLNFGDNKIFFAEDDQPRVAQYIVEEVQKDELLFQHPVYKQIYEEIGSFVNNKEKINQQYFVTHENVEVSKIAIDLMTTNYELSKIWIKNEVRVETEEMKLKETIPELVTAFKNQKVQSLIRETQEEIVSASKNNDVEAITMAQQKLIILNDLRRNISKNLGDRIIV